jgi:predicted nucleic acid-binding protein
MCLIVDANAAGDFLAQSSAVTDWLLGSKGKPRLVAAGKLKEELLRVGSVGRLLVQLDRAGRLRSASADILRREETRLRAQKNCKSNDLHVLALAIVSGARTLVTRDDALTNDFNSAQIINKPRGSVYRDPAKHRHLLRHTPSSCGVGGRA